MKAQLSVATDSSDLAALLEGLRTPTAPDFSLSELLIVADVVEPSAVPPLSSSSQRCTASLLYRDSEHEVTLCAWPAVEVDMHKCPRCWRFNTTNDGELCHRCAHV